jgi:hypothetical protein
MPHRSATTVLRDVLQRAKPLVAKVLYRIAFLGPRVGGKRARGKAKAPTVASPAQSV